MAQDTPSFFYLEALVEHANQIAFAYNIAEKRFGYLNPAFEDILQMPRHQAMVSPFALLERLHPEDAQYLENSIRELLEGAVIREMELRFLMPDQKVVWLCVRPNLLQAEQIITGYAEDVSASKNYIDTLKKITDKKNAILNIISHELAGPLGIIQSLSAMLADDLKPNGNEEVQHVIRLIEKSSQQGMQLIQEFIKQEFLESASAELIRRRVDLVQALKGIMEEYQQNQQLTGKTFLFHASSDSIFMNLDDHKFMQAINNLLSNALKFTPDGGRVTVSLEEKESSIRIRIEDNGIGIPEKYHATLFNKFTPARRPGIKGEPSIGLGMSITKTIVEWHKGSIWFDSQENKGTCFYIELPQSQYS